MDKQPQGDAETYSPEALDPEVLDPETHSPEAHSPQASGPEPHGRESGAVDAYGSDVPGARSHGAETYRAEYRTETYRTERGETGSYPGALEHAGIDLLGMDLESLRTVQHPVLSALVGDLRERIDARGGEALWGYDSDSPGDDRGRA